MVDRTGSGRISTSRVVWDEIDSHPVNYTTAYLRRLIAERAYIRAALVNPGGSIITHGMSLDLEGAEVYSSQIGNDFHLDLIEAEGEIVRNMSKEQRDTLLSWASGVDEDTASELMRVKPAALRKRRQRAVERLAEKMNDDDFGGRSRIFAEEVRRGAGIEPKEDGDT